MNKTTRRTLLVLALAVLMLAPGAAAAKGRPTPPAAVYYEVTMSLDAVSDGLATTCEAGSIRMLYDTAHGMLTATGDNGTEVARLFVKLGIPWWRDYPYSGVLGQSGPGFNECHGGQAPLAPGVWGGNLMISIDGAGNPTRILWHFDHYVEQTVGKRGKVTTSLYEGFTLSSGDTLSYDPATHIASGSFALFRWYPGTYELQGTSTFSFTLILSQVS